MAESALTEEEPFVANITQTETRLDPLTQQLLFGLDGEGGFIPGAFRAAERVFFDDQGRPIVIPQEIAGLTPDQLRAAQLQRQAIGVQQPFIEEAMRLGREGLGSLRGGFAGQAEADQRALQELQEASRFALDQRDRALLDQLRGGARAEERALAAERGLRSDLTDALGIGTLATQQLSGALGESERLLRQTTPQTDIVAETERFMDPFEQRVVDQTLEDAFKGLAQRDIAQRARDISTGGESAFGSRARLSAEERAEALGRGLAKEIGGLRSAGFQRAQQTAISEDERQKQAARAAASGLAGLSGQRFGATTGLAGQVGQQAQQRFSAGQSVGQQLNQLGQQAGQARLMAGQTGLGVAGQLGGLQRGIGATMAGQGQALQQAQQGLGGFMTGLGQQQQAATAADVSALSGIGAQQQQQRQRELDAQRAALLQAQQAPLAQYQALMPFVQMAPAGRFQQQTQFGVPPSALQAGLGTGLAAFGALGNFYGQPNRATQGLTNQPSTFQPTGTQG